MQKLKDNWPVLVLAAFAAGLFVAQNRGWLTGTQVEIVLAIFGVGGSKATLHMDPPGVAAASTVTHITIPPKGQS